MVYNIEKELKTKRTKILNFCCELIKVPTINPPCENYQRIVDLIKNEFDGQFHAKIYCKNNKPNLIIRWDVKSKKTIHINSHYDVVPAQGHWNSDPFEPKITNGKIFGRGSADSKSNICVSVYALILMKELRLKPSCNVELSFTCDEESGGFDGLGYLVKEKTICPDYAIVADGPVKGINNAHKGVLALKITVIGRSCHAGWPQRGINAFIGACALASDLNALNNKYAKIKSKCDTKQDEEKSPSIVLGGKAEGGARFNSVPGEFSFTIDRRIIPEEDINKVKKEITTIINRFKSNNKKYSVKIETLVEAKPSFTDKNAKISVVLSNNIRKVTGNKPHFFLLPGFLDMRYIVNDLKIGCVNYGTKGSNEHGENEFVDINSIFENIKIIVSLLTDDRLNS